MKKTINHMKKTNQSFAPEDSSQEIILKLLERLVIAQETQSSFIKKYEKKFEKYFEIIENQLQDKF